MDELQATICSTPRFCLLNPLVETLFGGADFTPLSFLSAREKILGIWKKFTDFLGMSRIQRKHPTHWLVPSMHESLQGVVSWKGTGNQERAAGGLIWPLINCVLELDQFPLSGLSFPLCNWTHPSESLQVPSHLQQSLNRWWECFNPFYSPHGMFLWELVSHKCDMGGESLCLLGDRK